MFILTKENEVVRTIKIADLAPEFYKEQDMENGKIQGQRRSFLRPWQFYQNVRGRVMALF